MRNEYVEKIKNLVQKNWLLVFFMALIFVTLLLAWRLEAVPPHVYGTPKLNWYGNYLQVEVDFDRPMDRESLLAAVNFNQDLQYKASILGEKLVIAFQEVLPADAQIELNIAASARDIYRRNLGQDFQFTFRTPQMKLAYLQRVPLDDFNNDDRIVIANADGSEPQTLFLTKDILMYDIGAGNWAAVSMDPAGRHTITVGNVDSDLRTELELGEIQVASLDISIDGKWLVANVQSVKVEQNLAIPKQEIHRVMLYNLETKKLEEFKTSIPILDFISAQFIPDGSALLIKGTNGMNNNYYLVNLHDGNEFVDLGVYMELSDFAQNGDYFLGISSPYANPDALFPQIVRVSANREPKNIGDSALQNIIDTVSFQDEIIGAILYSPVERTRGLYELIKLDPTTGKFSTLIRLTDLSVELPQISPDNNYLVAEIYTTEQLQNFQGLRNLGYQTKPYGGNLLIYDLNKNEVVKDKIDGINAVWWRED